MCEAIDAKLGRPWTKLGLTFATDGTREWSRTHAQVPVVDAGHPDRLRVYYSTRDSQNQSRISFVDVDRNDPTRVLNVHPEPVLDLGPIGAFDDCGVMPTCILRRGTEIWLYYIGWTRKVKVPYHNSIGLAVSRDGGETFGRMFPGPIIGTSRDEPYFCGTAFVLEEGDLLRMWYLSCTGWLAAEPPDPIYDIKYAQSHDGIDWVRLGAPAIPLADGEGGLVSASVVRRSRIYEMWYGRRGRADFRTNSTQSYRIGYAQSENGRDWLRLDRLAGMELSPSGWDSEMVSYPYTVRVGARLLMFYNGNGFGMTGFGCAEQPW